MASLVMMDHDVESEGSAYRDGHMWSPNPGSVGGVLLLADSGHHVGPGPRPACRLLRDSPKLAKD